MAEIARQYEPFTAWAQLLDHISGGYPLYYHAPLDYRPAQVSSGIRGGTRSTWRGFMLPDQPTNPVLVCWVHPEWRLRIYVYADHKRRVFYSHPENSRPDVDQWPVLWRRDVSALSDTEWTAWPGEGWKPCTTTTNTRS